MIASNSDERADSTVISTPTPNTMTKIGVSGYRFNTPQFKSQSHSRGKSKREHYQHLNKVDQGRRNGTKWVNSRLLTYEDNINLIRTFVAQLELSIPQKEVAVGEFINLDLQMFGVAKEYVALAVCAYVVKKDDRNQVRKTHPACDKSDQDSLFVDMAEAIGLTDADYQSMYGKVAWELPDDPSRHHRPPWEVSERSWKEQGQPGVGGGGT